MKRVLFFKLIVGFSCIFSMEPEHILRLEDSSPFYSFCTEYFYQEMLKRYHCKENKILNYVFDHLNNKTLSIEIISQIPFDKPTSEQFLPNLNFAYKQTQPIIRWDIRQLEERAMRHAIKEKKKRKKFKTQYIILEKGSTPRKEDILEKKEDQHPHGFLHTPILETKESELTSCFGCKQVPRKVVKSKKGWFKRHQTPLVTCSVGAIGIASGWFANAWWQSQASS